MRKSDKKIDNQLRLMLTDVCEDALKHIDGFQWLTHTVNYQNFPNSLKIICVFDFHTTLDDYKQSPHSKLLISLITQVFTDMNIKIKRIEKHVFYDTQESCDKYHNGNWAQRLASN